MYRVIFFLFILFYLYCEISLIIVIGSNVGALGVIMLMGGISILGIWLIRLQGLNTLINIQKKISTGELPTKHITSSVIFIICGLLFIIPGFLSDILAILLLIPFTRKIVQNLVLDLLFRKFKFVSYTKYHKEMNGNGMDETIFEAEFEHRDNNDTDTKKLKN